LHDQSSAGSTANVSELLTRRNRPYLNRAAVAFDVHEPATKATNRFGVDMDHNH
jgi:hypothetical protein